MRRLFSFLVVLGCCLTLYAQNRPQRLPEEEARTRTERLCRELSITDSVQRQQLYAMHLQFIQQRQVSNTRQEIMQRMLDIDAKLKALLTPEQYKRFMSHQVNPEPRHRQHPFGTMRNVAPHKSKSGTRPQPNNFLPTDHL